MSETPYKDKKSYPVGPNSILNNPIDTGYGVTTPNISADKSSSWNVLLETNEGVYIKLWAEDIQMDFAMAGSTGQSRFRNQFYPKSFNQPKLQVSGRMPNQYEYNRLANFVRENHMQVLSGVEVKAPIGQQTVQAPVIKLFIRGNSLKTYKNVKGGHKAHSFEGYISNIQAGAIKFNFAPEFKFEFIPLKSKFNGQYGLYDDQLLTKGIQILSYMDLFNKNKKAWGVQEADDFAAQDAEVLRRAREEGNALDPGLAPSVEPPPASDELNPPENTDSSNLDRIQ
jgi:hypothetical protein